MLPAAFTDRIILGGSSLKVSPVCLGCVDDPDMVSHAFERGINFFFVTTDMHWPGYRGLREGLARLFQRGVGRDEVVVAGVTYLTQPEFTVAPFLELTDEVPGLVGVDIVLAGGAYEADLGPSGRIHAFRNRVARHGRPHQAFPRASASGASFHSRPAALEAVNSDLVDIAFVRYNALHPGARTDLFPHLRREAGPAVFCFKTQNGFVPHDFFTSNDIQGVWKPAFADHYRFVLSDPGVDGVLCVVETLDELRDLEQALAKEPLPPEGIEYMTELARLYRG